MWVSDGSPRGGIELKRASPIERSASWRSATLVLSVWVCACSPERAALGSEDSAPDGSEEVSTTRLAQSAAPARLAAPDAPPIRWIGLIGEYGPDEDVWLILENQKRLHALRAETTSPLEEVSPDEFLPTASAMETGGRLVFTRGEDGRASGFRTAGAYFEKREVGAIAGETFKIVPVRDVEELRVEALAASPPAEGGTFRDSELVDLTSLDPTIRLEIRYATTNNFMNAGFYEDARAFLQRPAAAAVARASRALVPYGYGLLIHDGYRPWYVTKMFWDATPIHQREFVANPATGSRHNRGAAIDLTLYDLASGSPVPMPGSYDEFSHRSYSDYPGGTARQRWHRDLLRQVMESEGFTVNSGEWWHFDYRDWREYGIQNDVFGEIDVSNQEEP